MIQPDGRSNSDDDITSVWEVVDACLMLQLSLGCHHLGCCGAVMLSYPYTTQCCCAPGTVTIRAYGVVGVMLAAARLSFTAGRGALFAVEKACSYAVNTAVEAEVSFFVRQAGIQLHNHQCSCRWCAVLALMLSGSSIGRLMLHHAGCAGAS